jgi:hypothetical protein
MMEVLRSYLLSIIAAAVVCWIATALLPKTGSISALGKLLTGVFMTVTILSPVVSWKLPDIGKLTSSFDTDAAEAVSVGKSISQEAISAIIKQQCEAYILDKAADFGAQIEVTVSVTMDAVPIPCGVRISGAYSPYARLRLGEIIHQELGIGEEAQNWIN